MVNTLASIHNSLLARVIFFMTVCVFVSLIIQTHLNAEEKEAEKEAEKVVLSSISWGRKYFFDAPRFKENNVQELLDSAIEEKLKTYGIQVSEGGNMKYELNYTLILEEEASQSEIEELLNQEPELRASDEDLIVEQGKFIISIRDRHSRIAIWKNSIEGLANLERSDDARQKRIDDFIEKVFMTFSN